MWVREGDRGNKDNKCNRRGCVVDVDEGGGEGKERGMTLSSSSLSCAGDVRCVGERGVGGRWVGGNDNTFRCGGYIVVDVVVI